LRSFPERGWSKRGFTLLEALVALGLIVAFAATLVPYLFQARRIMTDADGRVAAQALLRTLIEGPLDRRSAARASRDGETAGLRWSLRTEPIDADPAPVEAPGRMAPEVDWSPFRVVATVWWAPGHALQIETVRLFKAE
jgi:general secretion pathway protein I